jgi:hypothetical protein
MISYITDVVSYTSIIYMILLYDTLHYDQSDVYSHLLGEAPNVRQQTTPEAVTEEMGLTRHRSWPKCIVQPNRRHVGPEWTK